MNGYKVIADSYRKLLEQEQGAREKEKIESTIKVYDMLSELTENEVYCIFDSGAFNDVVKGYCRKAIKMCGLSDVACSEVMSEIGNLLSEVKAKEILEIQ